MNQMDIHEVLKHLPHRYPFLLIDRVLQCTAGKSLSALKNVTINEPFFQGHFPHRPVMPGVMILEALAQATGLLGFRSQEARSNEQLLFYLVGIDKARFKQPVEPGDQLILEVELKRKLRGLAQFSGIAKVSGKVVAEAELMCTQKEIKA